MRMLLLLLPLMLPAAVQALDYEYTVNDDHTATITGYTGSGGNVNIPDYIYDHKVVAIGDWAFNFCYSLTSVTIPNTVTNLGQGVFYYCTALTNVSIPNTVTVLNDYVLSECSSLTSVIIPNSVTNIGNYAFADDAGLSSVTIPNSVTGIEDGALSDCHSLTSLTIPANVTTIGSGTFSFCPNLTGICFLGDAPTIGDGIFESSTAVIVYYLPDTSGWDTDTYFGDQPTMLWNAQMQTDDGCFGVRTNQFGFNITGGNSLVIVVEACTDLSNPVWSRLQTNTITTGSVYFSDPAWTNYPIRYYQVIWP